MQVQDKRLKSFSLKGWHIGVVSVIAIVLLVLLYVMFAYDALSCKKKAERETLPCYLCDDRVDKLKWNDGSHRRSCAIKKRVLLERMAKPLELHCPNCHSVLRLWPANLGMGFHCDDPECRYPGDEIKNSGFNRLNCFICDYDICMACANRKICEKQRVKPNAQRKLGTGLSTGAWMIHMNPLVQDNLRSRRRSSARAAPVTSLKRKTTKPRLGSRKRSKSVKVARATSDDSHQLESFSDIPERPLIPKEPSSRNFLVPPAQKRIPKITFKAQSFEYDDSTEVHTVQVDVEFIKETETSLKKKETVLSVNCSPKHQSEQIL